MSVHEAISKHSQQQHRHLIRFEELDALREAAIEQAIDRCRRNEPFTVDEINRITAAINEHAKHGISPTRKLVTPELVRAHVDSLRSPSST